MVPAQAFKVKLTVLLVQQVPIALVVLQSYHAQLVLGRVLLDYNYHNNVLFVKMGHTLHYKDKLLLLHVYNVQLITIVQLVPPLIQIVPLVIIAQQALVVTPSARLVPIVLLSVVLLHLVHKARILLQLVSPHLVSV